jgi:hypothetical protein
MGCLFQFVTLAKMTLFVTDIEHPVARVKLAPKGT